MTYSLQGRALHALLSLPADTKRFDRKCFFWNHILNLELGWAGCWAGRAGLGWGWAGAGAGGLAGARAGAAGGNGAALGLGEGLVPGLGWVCGQP